VLDRRLVVAVVLGAVLAVAGGARAADAQLGALRVDNARAGATAPRQATAAAYLTLANGGPAADRLIAAASPAAEQVRLHMTAVDANGVATMRAVDVLQIPAGGAVSLEPGGLHLMLEGLKAPLAAGSTVVLVLRFERAGEVRLDVPVRSPREIARGAGKHPH